MTGLPVELKKMKCFFILVVGGIIGFLPTLAQKVPTIKMIGRRAPQCNIPCIRPETFAVSDHERWMTHLEEEGFAVLHDVISQEDADLALETFKQEFCAVSPRFDWEDKDTWTTDNCPMVWNKSSVVYNGFGQSDSNWLLRTNSLAKEAFACVYGTDELATSFDGFSLFLSDTQKSPSWLHQDQRPSDDRHSVQAILNVLPCGAFDAGFICVPRSHKTYVPADATSDWMMLPKDDPNQKLAQKILTPPRSLILFNSKTIHANIGMVKNHPNGTHVNRFSAYTTFVPKSRQTPEILDARMKGYFTGVATSHWGDRFEPKKIPFHIRKRYIERGFNDLPPTTTPDGEIPPERLALI